ncbi:hypothetical protein E0W80_09510 [Microbacterium sp. PI-1]|uniref:hypothetical protein n=1 Tax=unclassified Microbacterium TaxID=2609290 RepID=UPI001040AB4E|nr:MULTISPECIES: hypothetical protein [unclassified Microbacterium]TCJ23787.1 hypothetical protein E0W80_09510 [Microbacterium sp. PI-1]UUE20074.1 hypothetical protein LRQ07_14945 [Microbacterium sp. J1-1]
MQVVAGDLPLKKDYQVMSREISTRWGMKRWSISRQTVESIEMKSDRFLNSVTATSALFEVGKTLADLTVTSFGNPGQATILFEIKFRDGKSAVCHGSAQEYKKLLGWASKDDKKALRKERKAAR